MFAKEDSMKIRIVSLVLGALALVVFASAPVAGQAQKAKDASQAEKGKTHKGTFISAKGQTFKMEDKSGKEHQHTLSIKAKVVCDGKECKLADLKRGQEIMVTTLASDPMVATRVEAKTK
jgi:hypothetical protein